MVLLKGIELEFLLSLSRIFDKITEKLHIDTPIFAFLTTFFELEQHFTGGIVILNEERDTCRQMSAKERLNLI